MGVMPHTEDLIGTAEAARILGRSHRTVHRMVRDGELTPALTAPGGPAGVVSHSQAAAWQQQQQHAARSQSMAAPAPPASIAAPAGGGSRSVYMPAAGGASDGEASDRPYHAL